MGKTFKDREGKQSRKPTKKERRELDKLTGNERYGAYQLSRPTSDGFKSSYRKLKIEGEN